MALKLLLSIILVMGSIALLADGVQPDGSGTEDAPYQVATLDNLLWVSTNSDSWGSHFIQTADIDAGDTQNWNEGEGFSPIGSYPSQRQTQFHGDYDGQGYTIEGLYINRPALDHQGLFGYTQAALIENLGVTNVDVTGNEKVGGLVGLNCQNTTVNSCYSTGIVTGNEEVGGLIGESLYSCTIANCYSTVSLGGTADRSGGLVGENDEYSTISNCYSSGSVSGDGYTGGLVGLNSDFSLISNCFSTGSTTGGFAVGGLVGQNKEDSSVSNCYSTGNVAGVGGIADNIGGLVGSIVDASISNCYSTGIVSGDAYVGGFAGRNYGTISISFWDTETSGTSTGIGHGTIIGATGKTTAEMQTLATYTDAGWDFMEETANGTEDFWGLNYEENGGYPFLEWQGYTHNPVSVMDETEAPLVTHLGANYPNPFNPTTTIKFSVQVNETAILEIFNMRGQLVKSYPAFSAGNHEVVWNGADNSGRSVASGVYLYRLQSGSAQQARKMMMLK
ncbi:MAG: T9SS type A sorting domain-containing protein [Candidatus Cloacimonetes bacterium]|nr:T9SS type A sorting domain-containing protein [Candidatus Cloacimonadota bacterium]